jgi:predicted nucleic acid-binding protein
MTSEAAAALAGVDRRADRLAVPSTFLVEFMSVLRKAVARRRYLQQEADEILKVLRAINPTIIEPTTTTLDRAWQLSIQLGQSDVFDSLGYALAEEIGAEFWTADRRFTNAAEAAGLPAVRYVA